MKAWFKGATAPQPQPQSQPPTQEATSFSPSSPAPEDFVVLVIQEDAYNWPAIFGDETVHGRRVRVVQTGWRHLSVGPVENYSGTRNRRCTCTVFETTERGETGSPPASKQRQTIWPDMVLIRNEVSTHAEDHRSKLFGLMYADVPAVNSLQSIYMSCERPVVQAELNKLRAAHGEAAFPVIDQAYAASHRDFFYPLGFPAVVKVGAAHAGFGKMKISDHHQMSDFASVLALGGQYCLMEPYVPGEYDIRVQRVGDRVRAFSRQSVSGDWKTNTGTSVCQEIPVTEEFQRWADLCKPMFGGLDIFTVDAIHTESGKNTILEVNGTSSGLFPDRADEDNNDIKDLVLAKARELTRVA